MRHDYSAPYGEREEYAGEPFAPPTDDASISREAERPRISIEKPDRFQGSPSASCNGCGEYGAVRHVLTVGNMEIRLCGRCLDVAFNRMSEVGAAHRTDV